MGSDFDTHLRLISNLRIKTTGFNCFLPFLFGEQCIFFLSPSHCIVHYFVRAHPYLIFTYKFYFFWLTEYLFTDVSLKILLFFFPLSCEEQEDYPGG